MQVISLVVWLGFLTLLAKLVNHFAKRLVINPWVWLAASYAISYLLGLFVGFAKNAPNLAYVAGSFFPITIFGIALGIWRAPKWEAAQLKRQEERMAPAD